MNAPARLAVRAYLLGAFAGAAAAPAPAEEWSLPPVVSADLTVEGAWRMDRDVVVQKGATLRIRPGARIVVEAADRGRSGNLPARCELHVHGRLVIEGTAAAPAVFETVPSNEPGADGVSWGGIVLHADRQRTPDSVLMFAKIRGARDAVQVTDGTPRIESSVFHGCDVGVAAGSVWGPDFRVAEASGAPQPEIAGCLFVRCGTGVFTEARGAPSVVRSSFVDCTLGLGNTRVGGLILHPDSLGAHVERALFLRCDVAVEGSSLIEDSIFLRNRVALDVTRLHGRYSVGIDRISWRRNVLWENTVVAAGESDLGGDLSFADPRIDVPDRAPSFDEARAPLAGAALPPGSPLRGTALDGGDPGPAGRGAEGRRRRPWGSRARALRRFLVLGPADRVDVTKLPKTAPLAAGERVGEAWWCAFAADEAGGLDRAALGWPGTSPIVPLALLWNVAGPGGIAEVELNVDGRAGLWRAGTSVPFPDLDLRHGSRGLRVPLPASGPDGPAGLVIWWRSTDLDPRIGVAVHAAAGSAVAEADAPPVPALEAEPIRFGPKQVGIRLKGSFHWADLRRPGVFRLVGADRSSQDLAGLQLIDAKGTIRADLPPGAVKAASRIVVTALRDVWGRPFTGQPLEIDAEPR